MGVERGQNVDIQVNQVGRTLGGYHVIIKGYVLRKDLRVAHTCLCHL